MKLKLLILLTSASLAASCGSPLEMSESKSEGSSNLTEEGFDHLVVPPKEYYDAVMKRELSLLGLASTQTAPVLFVDFDGASLEKGYGLGQSFILCSRKASIPAAGFSPAAEDEILASVQEFYQRAGTNLVVTKTAPSTGRFTTMIVGGSMGSLGCVDRRGILGVAPFDKSNVNKDDIGFVFTKYVSSVRVTAETIAHEAGHSFGLDHIQQSQGLMYASNSSNIEGFIDGTVRARARQNAPTMLQASVGKAGTGTTPNIPSNNQGGTVSNTPPDVSNPNQQQTPTIPGMPNIPGNIGGIPGLDQIAGIGGLLGGLNPGQLGGQLDLSNLLGQFGSLIPGGLGGGLPTGGIPGLGNIPGMGGIPGLGNIPGIGGIGGLAGLDDILGVIGIANQVPGIGSIPGAGGQIPDFGQLIPGAGNIGNITDLLGAFGGAGGIPGMGGIPGLDSLIGMTGFGNMTDLIPGIQDLIGLPTAGGGLPNLPIPGNGGNIGLPIGQLPDLGNLLGVGGIANLPDLLGSLNGQANVISSNYTGAEKEALLSMLKVGYLQSYQKLP